MARDHSDLHPQRGPERRDYGPHAAADGSGCVPATPSRPRSAAIGSAGATAALGRLVRQAELTCSSSCRRRDGASRPFSASTVRADVNPGLPMIGAGSIPVIGSRSPWVLPDAYPVDEHNRRKGTPAGITGAWPTHRKIEDRKHQVVGLVERPHPLDGDRRNSEVGLRAVYVVAPEAETGLIPSAPPVVPLGVHQLGDRFS